MHGTPPASLMKTITPPASLMPIKRASRIPNGLSSLCQLGEYEKIYVVRAFLLTVCIVNDIK